MNIDDFLRDTRINYIISWFLVSLIALVLVESLLEIDILWIIFSGLVLTLAVLPALAYRNYEIMPPFEVIVLASVPVIVSSFNLTAFSGELATYLSIAAVALLIAVEIHIFTEARFTHSFAVAFTVISTLAIAGVWSIIRFLLDARLGTNYLSTNEALMIEYFTVLIAGLLAGILFDSYFRRRDRFFIRKFRKVINR